MYVAWNQRATRRVKIKRKIKLQNLNGFDSTANVRAESEAFITGKHNRHQLLIFRFLLYCQLKQCNKKGKSHNLGTWALFDPPNTGKWMTPMLSKQSFNTIFIICVSYCQWEWGYKRLGWRTWSMKDWTAKTTRWESWKCRIPVMPARPSMQIFTAGQEFAFLSLSPIFTDINMQKWAVRFWAAPSDIPSAKRDMNVLALRLISTTWEVQELPAVPVEVNPSSRLSIRWRRWWHHWMVARRISYTQWRLCQYKGHGVMAQNAWTSRRSGAESFNQRLTSICFLELLGIEMTHSGWLAIDEDSQTMSNM